MVRVWRQCEPLSSCAPTPPPASENGTTLGVNGSAIPSAPGEASFGDLTVGFGALGDPNLIGPEFGFGWGMHIASGGASPILVMKTAWGGKTLAEDFRPPSSVAAAAAGRDPYCQGACPNVVGHFYATMVADVHKMLAPGAVAAMFPDLVGLTPVLAGFGAWAGRRRGGGCRGRRARLHMCHTLEALRVRPLRCSVSPLTLSHPPPRAGWFQGGAARHAQHARGVVRVPLARPPLR